MNLKREDYVDPRCALCGKPGEEETIQPVPVGRIMDKLREYEDRNDWPAVERHLKYWLAEAVVQVTLLVQETPEMLLSQLQQLSRQIRPHLLTEVNG